MAIAASFSVMTATNASAQQSDSTEYRKFRFGGYGEMYASFKDYGINRFQKDGSTKERRNTIAIPRFVVAFDYKFNPKWVLGAEIEFESGGTGSAFEIENSENGEYETEIEKGGEVALEQFHITRLIAACFNIRAGHIIVPVGLTNAHHEPTNFFGTIRPESETALLPSTWHETGIEIFGTFGSGYGRFDYQAMVVAGLNANGFDRNEWIAGGKQGYFETDNFTSPAYAGRIDWCGIRGLRTGISVYYCNDTGANADKSQHYAAYDKIPVTLFTWDMQYSDRFVTLRSNVLYGSIGNSGAVNDRNGRLPGASPYSRLTPIAKNALSYSYEIGINLGNVLGAKRFPTLYPFVKYEYYNSQYRVSSPYTADRRLETGKWTAGIDWYVLPNLVLKADYSTRQIGTNRPFGKGTYNSENEITIGLAFIGWFIQK